MPKRQPRTVLEFAVARGGFRRGTRAMNFCMCWLTVEVMTGRPPTVDEYAAWWKVSRATAFRDQQAWREVFPEFDTPTVLFDRLGINRSVAEKANVSMMAMPAV